MFSGNHMAPCGTITTAQNAPKHAYHNIFQRKQMVNDPQCRNHRSTPCGNHNHRNPSGVYTRQRQRMIDAGWRRHGPPHGVRRHRHNSSCWPVAQKRNAMLPLYNSANVPRGACGAHGTTRGLRAYPTLPQGLKPLLPDSGPLLGLLWVTMGGLA